MNLFSEQLRAFISQKNASISQMAAFCGIDRSSMYKIVHGTRRPGSDALVRQIALFLKLSPEESGILQEKYLILQNGQETYQRQKGIHAFMQTCFDDGPLPVPYNIEELFSFSLSDHQDSSMALRGKETILNVYGIILQKEMERENGLIRIRMQPEDRFMDLLLALRCFRRKENGFRIQHIMSLDGSSLSEESTGVNLALIHAALPVCKAYLGYELYYFHSNLRTEQQSFSFFPYIVITGDYALQISRDLRFAILHNLPETVFFCAEMFSRVLSSCINMTAHVRDYRDLLFFGKQRNAGRGPVLLDMFPCMSFCLTPDLIDRYMIRELPERSLLLSTFLDVIEQDREYVTSSPALILTSERGLRTFLETGLLPGYPSELYEPIRPDDRILLLQRYREIVRMRSITFRIIRENFANTSSGSSVWMDDHCAYFLFQDRQLHHKYLFLRDPGILASLHSFFRNIREDLCLSQAQSLEILDRLLREASE